MVYLLHTGRKLGLRTAVDDICVGTQAFGRPHCVHCHITATHNGHLLTAPYGGVVLLGGKSTHQVDTGQELVGREYTVEVLALDAHKFGQTCARAYKYCVEALFVHQAVDGYGTAHDDVLLELNAQPCDLLDLSGHDALFGQTELGNAVAQHAAQAVECLKYGNLVAQFGQIGSTSQAGRATTHNGHFLAVFLDVECLFRAVLQLPIAHKALQLADSHGLVLDAQDTRAFALALLGAHTATNRGQQRVLGNNLGSHGIVALANGSDEVGNLDTHRASAHTARIAAVQTARSLPLSLLYIKSVAHLLEVGGTFGGVLLPYGGA